MNKTIFMGRITKDPELRFVGSNNMACCNFTMAVDRSYRKEGEEKQSDFIPIVVFGKLAENFVAKYLTKGLRILVEGRLQTKSWDDADGKKRYGYDIIAEKVEIADGKKTDSSNLLENIQESVEEGEDVLPF